MCCQEKGSYSLCLSIPRASEGFGHLRYVLSGERLIYLSLSIPTYRKDSAIYDILPENSSRNLNSESLGRYSALYDMCYQEKSSYTFVFQFREPRKDSGHLRYVLSGERLIYLCLSIRRASEGFGHLRYVLSGERLIYLCLSIPRASEGFGHLRYVLSGERLIYLCLSNPRASEGFGHLRYVFSGERLIYLCLSIPRCLGRIRASTICVIRRKAHIPLSFNSESLGRIRPSTICVVRRKAHIPLSFNSESLGRIRASKVYVRAFRPSGERLIYLCLSNSESLGRIRTSTICVFLRRKAHIPLSFNSESLDIEGFLSPDNTYLRWHLLRLDMCCQEKGSYTFVFQHISEMPRKDSGIYDMCCQEKGSYTFVFQFRASEGFGHLRYVLSGERLIYLCLSIPSLRRIRPSTIS